VKALILNSGVGSRMIGLNSCKCLIELADGVTILDAQIQALLHSGIDDLYITTGAHASELETYARTRYRNVNLTFVHNPLFRHTNYIYSIHLARDLLLDDDVLLIHGDLVFEENVLLDVVASDRSVMVTDSTRPLPEKDFKAVVTDGRIRNVNVDTFSGAVCAQPLYKLTRRDWSLWLDEVERFCRQDMTGVYAENALNSISDQMDLFPLDITGRICFEIDNNEDLECARDAYARRPDRLQTVYSYPGARRHVRDIINGEGARKPFVVCGHARHDAEMLFGPDAVYFSEFTSNPGYHEIMAGISAFEEERCDFIVSIGGGSAIDTAKCVSILVSGDALALRDTPRSRQLSIPTTAGTGSESTSIAVMYKEGIKQSIAHKGIMPDYAILDFDLLATLPMYHKKSALLDALCQSIESLWARGKTRDSMSYAMGAIRIIQEDADAYIIGSPGCSQRILNAANLSGKAINISKTTAAHAMSYKLSTMFGLAHGHAVALCLVYVWAHFLKSVNTSGFKASIDYDEFTKLFAGVGLEQNIFVQADELETVLQELVVSVNPERLGNHPVGLSETEIACMYRRILRGSAQQA